MDRELKNTTKNVDRYSWRQPMFFALVIAAVCWLVWLIVASPFYEALAWTGFAASTNAAGQVTPAKTLWDWLGLIIIPVTLAAGGFWFNHSQKDREETIAARRAEEEREVADERAQETALQTYLDQMSRLLINYPPTPTSLAGTEYEVPDGWSNVARVWTLTILRRLNGERKGIVLRFLYESNLIQGSEPVVSLASADLTGAKLSSAKLNGAKLAEADLSDAVLHFTRLVGADLHKANLFGADLLMTDLTEANLSGAILANADLNGAKLIRADLSQAQFFEAGLVEADLSNAHLSGADLSGAYLGKANLSGADLNGAYLTWAQLVEAKFNGANLQKADLSEADLTWADLNEADLNGATCTTETIWPDGFDPAQAGTRCILKKDIRDLRGGGPQPGFRFDQD